MNRGFRPIALLAVLAAVLVAGVTAQQKAPDAAATPAPQAGMCCMHGQQAPAAEGAAKMAGCPMMARGAMAPGRMGHMARMSHMGGKGMGMGMGMGMACGPKCPLLGDDVEIAVEKTKDGAVLKVVSKNAETVKAVQDHLAEHLAMMKEMKKAAAEAGEAGACASCPVKR